MSTAFSSSAPVVPRYQSAAKPFPPLSGGQQLAARLGERQIAEFVEHHQINAGELLGQPAGDAGASLGLQTVDQVDDVEEARPSVALAYAIGGDGDRQMAFAGAG